MEDDLGWKTTLEGRRPLMEDNLGLKMTLDGRQTWMEWTLDLVLDYFLFDKVQVQALISQGKEGLRWMDSGRRMHIELRTL